MMNCQRKINRRRYQTCDDLSMRYRSYPRVAKKVLEAPLPEQPIKLGFDDLITFAACRFQSLTVEDRDVAADVADQPGLLQAPGRLGDTLAASSQHVGDELLGEQQFHRPYPVVCEQQPAAESLL